MKRLAIIGTGVAGLGCAHFLHSHYEVTVFGADAHAGGHSNTVTVREGDREVAIDTGFMVYNQVTYPNLTRLFKELDAPVKKTSMSFSVQHAPTGLEYCGSSVNHLFAQRRNLVRPRFWRMLRQIDRFNNDAVKALEEPATRSQSLQEYVETRGYGKDLFNLYLVPMSSAVWSTPPEKMLRFPAHSLLRFFHNHGFLGLHTQHQWWTVDGGAKEYVRRLTRPFADRIQRNRAALKVIDGSTGATVVLEEGESQTFDKVIIATHGDQALELLESPDADQSRLLGSFKYEPNVATLHTDPSAMPRTRRAWASWNYRIDADDQGGSQTSTIYWMNSLQGVSERENYFVSINGEQGIREDAILKQIHYRHPLFDQAAVEAQKQLPGLNKRSPDQRIYFCGSYFKYGFHEDAFTSGLDVSRAILGEEVWA